MRRWTDGKSWSASRVSGSFLTYREMEGKRGGTSFVTPANRSTKTPDSAAEDPSQNGDGEDGPDGYRYKPDGLMKQSFSITTSQGQHLHLISYYSRSHPTAQVLRQPSTDPNLTSIQPVKGLYPESTINDQSSVPAVTRSPMVGVPSYVMSPSTPGYHRPNPGNPHQYLPPGYLPHATYIYPISPMHTPPGHYALHPYGGLPPGLPPISYPQGPYAAHHPLPLNQAPPSSYDQRPLRTSELPAPPPPLTNGSAHPASTQYHPNPPPVPPPPTSSAPPNAPPPADGGERLQIDPRLTAPVDGVKPPANEPLPKAEEAQSDARQPESTTINASQAPSITALVHNLSTLPPVERSLHETEADRQASTSPGGSKNGALTQDIPSEKLGFREDKRALSKLDRVFARV